MPWKNGKHYDRRTNRTPPKIRGRPAENWRELFLNGLRTAYNVEYALRIAQVSKNTAYTHRKSDPDFRRAWDEAREEGLDRLRPELEESIMYKAIHGWEEPVFQGGKMCGTKIVFSVPLMTWAAERLLRERYHITPHFIPTTDPAYLAAAIASVVAGARWTIGAPAAQLNGAEHDENELSGAVV